MAGPLILILAGVLGACIGSAAVTAALRAARHEPFVFGRSRCDHCAVELSFAETVPVFSYLGRRGACSHCGARIAFTHFAGEGAGAAIAISALLFAPPLQAGLLVLLGILLLSASAFDVQVLRLPDILTSSIAILAVSLAAVDGPLRLFEGLCAALGSFLALGLISLAYQRLRNRPGLGMGDVKLISALALWLGLMTPWAVMFACFLGLIGAIIFHRDRRPFPFGPYIALGGWIVGLVRDPLLSVFSA